MALNRFNTQHARILRWRKLRELARPLASMGLTAAVLVWLLAFLATLDAALERDRTAHGWRGLQEQAHQARLEAAAEVHALRTGAPPATTQELVQAGLIEDRALRWPDQALQWSLDPNRVPPAFAPPLR